MKLSINALIADTSVLTAENNFGFTAWVSHEKTLERRMSVLIPKLKFLVDAAIINGDENYVSFNNVSSITGKGSYDDVRITKIAADEANEEYLGGFSFQTWGFAEGGNAHLFLVNEAEANTENHIKFTSFADWKEMKNALRDDKNLIDEVRNQFNKNFVEPVIEVVEKPVKVKKVAAVKKPKATKKEKTSTEVAEKGSIASALAKAMELAQAKIEAKQAMEDLDVIS